jgi:thiol-disulfide isomerase/thioredoxin
MLAAVSALTACGGELTAELQPAETAQIRLVQDVDALFADLEARRGRPLLVNLWAMWCSPCVAELPDLAVAHARLRESGGEVVGIAMDLSAPGQTLAAVRERLPGFLREHGVHYPVLLYVEGDPIPVIQRFELANGALPITIAVDAEGRIVGVHDGKASPAELEELSRLAAGG